MTISVQEYYRHDVCSISTPIYMPPRHPSLTPRGTHGTDTRSLTAPVTISSCNPLNDSHLAGSRGSKHVLEAHCDIMLFFSTSHYYTSPR